MRSPVPEEQHGDEQTNINTEEGHVRIAVAGVTGQIGALLAETAAARGHEVLGLSRASGIDLTSPDVVPHLAERLSGAAAVVDTTNLVSQDQEESTEFFTSVARHLSGAAAKAGLERTVLLSIIGVDGIPNDAHYAAKYRQELTYSDAAPGLHVVRAAHFHTFPGMVLEWGRQGTRATVQDIPVQPVDAAVVVDTLLDAATGSLAETLLDVAGPRQERLVDLVRLLAARRGDGVEVVPQAASEELTAGAALPGPHALLRGPSFQEWLDTTYPTGT
jgi:dTDP-4-dehydrorhamnose reductase